jgi:hypothetical protein
MKKLLFGCLLILVFFVWGGQGRADLVFAANLTLDQEVGGPPRIPTTSTGAPRPDSFGRGTLVLNDAMTALTMDVTIFNIDVAVTAVDSDTGAPEPPFVPQTPDTFDNLVAAHIHASATTGGPGTNAGVVWGFFATPFHNDAPNELVITPFSAASPGPGGATVGARFTATWNLDEGAGGGLAAQLPNILAGRSYLNFHTTQFGGGEIRGQLTLVPEPSTFVLASMGILSLCGYGWRRRRLSAP